MKFCKNCGNQIDENAIFCPRCGARANGDSPNINFDGYGRAYDTYGGYGYAPVDNQPSKFIAVLSFIFWWVGLAVWAFCRHTRPGKARSALKGLLGSACFSMPFIGAIFWALWKDDQTKSDYVKVASTTAIVGACFYALLIVTSIILKVTGIADAGIFVPIMEYMNAYAY